VNVYVPSHNESTDGLFNSAPLDTMSMNQAQPRRPRIVMTSHERSLTFGLVEITVAYDEKEVEGISVDVRGALGADVNTDILREVCRRGGTLGLCGRVWAKAGP
jgi:hypothetical protein